MIKHKDDSVCYLKKPGGIPHIGSQNICPSTLGNYMCVAVDIP